MPNGFVAIKDIRDSKLMHEFLSELFPNEVLTIHENVQEIRFDPGIPTQLMNNGRSFNSLLEVRWSTVGDKFHLLALSEDRGLLKEMNISNETFDVEDSSSMLWGKYEPTFKAFIEIRIPKRLCYPTAATEGKSLQLLTRYYVKDGVIQYTRYKDIAQMEAQEGNNG